MITCKGKTDSDPVGSSSEEDLEETGALNKDIKLESKSNIETSLEENANKTFNCCKCPKSFPEKWRLIRHMKTCKGKTKENPFKTFRCSNCSNSFPKKHILSQHMKTCKKKTKDHYKCKCSKTFAKPSTIKGHQKKCQAYQSILRKTTEAIQYDKIVKDRWKTYD